MVARIICCDGNEGTGKSTMVQKLYDYLSSRGAKVLLYKEPGTIHSPLSMVLRNIVLNDAYDSELTPFAREMLITAIRSITLNKVVIPAIDEYDFIIQDRGIVSGISYAQANSFSFDFLSVLNVEMLEKSWTKDKKLYDDIIHLYGNNAVCLDRAKSSKKEFADGVDVIEKRGVEFIEKVKEHMDRNIEILGVPSINIDNKSIDEVFSEILTTLKLENYVKE